jgi:hypothetical protein
MLHQLPSEGAPAMIRPAAEFPRNGSFVSLTNLSGPQRSLSSRRLSCPFRFRPRTQNPPSRSRRRRRPAPSPEEELAKLRKQVAQLTIEVGRLRAELAKLERYKTIDYTRELMLKEEQRVRELQKELVENAAKETVLQKRLDEIEEEERPDRIERSLAGVGSVKPEENEKQSVAD